MPEAPEIKVKLTAEDAGVSAAIKELGAQLKDLKRQDDETARSADGMASAFGRAGGSMREARGAARLLSQDLGVGLNRELASTLARSTTLGPLLSAAFPVVAAIGFFEVIKNGAEQFSALVSDTFIYTKEMKDAYASIVAGNKEIQKSVEHTQQLKDEFELIGTSGIARDTILLQRLSDQIDETKEKQRAAEGTLALSRDQILGGEVSAADVKKAEGDLQEATAKLKELTQGQMNVEKQIDIEQKKEAAEAATRAAQQLIRRQEQKDEAMSREATALRAGMERELELYKATEKEREETEKSSYDRGLISLQEYFAARRADLQNEQTQEIAIIQKEIADRQAEADRAGAEGRANQAKSRAAGPDTDIGRAYAGAAEKDFTTQQVNLEKIAELKTKIQIQEAEFRTKAAALDDEQATKVRENLEKQLQLEKEIAELQGNKPGAAQAEITAEAQRRTLEVKQAGGTDAEVNARLAEIETWKNLKMAVADYEDARLKLQTDERTFEIEKQAIEIKAKDGLISQAEKEKEINNLIRDRLPLLQADAAAEIAAAQKTGNKADLGAAQNAKQGIQNLAQASDSLGKQVSQDLTTDFDRFFMGIGRSTKSTADQFRQLAASVVQSLEQIIVKKMVLQMIGSTGGEGGGGSGLMGFLGPLFGAGHAEGGLIKGPGGPKTDSIPARLSAGEYVVKADAVSAFGAANLDAINRGLKIPSLERLALPKYGEGGLVGGEGGGESNINLGISLDEGLILKHLSSKAAGRIILNHLTNNPKAAGKALARGT